MTKPSAPRTARARVRAELMVEIKEVARRQLAEQGSAALSLRAVARELGMVSSAVYRYYPSRDDLLTALIIDAYDAVGDSAEAAEAAIRREDLVGRWLATARAARDWALARPQEYALIFGSPIPGYQAPADTVDPAARLPLLLVGICRDAVANGVVPVKGLPRMPQPVRADLRALRTSIAADLSEGQVGLAVMAWTQLVGSISFELFGHLHNVIHDYGAYFEYQMRGICVDLGLLTERR